jgi:hypothetical protein
MRCQDSSTLLMQTIKDFLRHMNSVIVQVFLLSLLILMQGCATTRYYPLGELQGEGIEQLNDRSFRVEYRVSPFTSQEVLDDFLRRRCAEVTLREGYDYFAMTERLDVLMFQRYASVTLRLYKGQEVLNRTWVYDARDVIGSPQN